MGNLSDLPPELIALIIDRLYDDREALEACTLASRIFLPRSQAHLFERITIYNTEVMRTRISSEPSGVLSYTRSLSIHLGYLTRPPDLEEIYDHLMAFKNISELKAHLFPTNFVEEGLGLLSRYFSHFQPTLFRLHLRTSVRSPKDVITFIAFFPLLEEASVCVLDMGPPPLPDSKSERFDPNLLSPLKGSMRLSQFWYENSFATELAKVQIQYHTLSICDVTVWTGFQNLIIACAPTLRVLNIIDGPCELFSLRFRVLLDSEGLTFNLEF